MTENHLHGNCLNIPHTDRHQVLYTLVYVVPFYLSPLTRPSATLTRDAPSVIKARVRSVSLTCIICSVSTLVILTSDGRASKVEALHSMGYWPVGLTETARSLLLTAVLFAGPLFETLIVDGGWRAWRRLEPVTELFKEWTTWRNIIAVSPARMRCTSTAGCARLSDICHRRAL